MLAHEIAHIANRDILIQTVAGVMASTIVSIANFMQFAAIFGMGRSSEDGEGGGGQPAHGHRARHPRAHRGRR